MKKKSDGGAGGKKDAVSGPKNKPIDKSKGGQRPSGPVGKTSKGKR